MQRTKRGPGGDAGGGGGSRTLRDAGEKDVKLRKRKVSRIKQLLTMVFLLLFFIFSVMLIVTHAFGMDDGDEELEGDSISKKEIKKLRKKVKEMESKMAMVAEKGGKKLIADERRLWEDAKALALPQNSLYRVKGIEDPMGKMFSMSRFNGLVSLIVTLACDNSHERHHKNFDQQLNELEQLQEKYQDQGFIVIGFPLDDFISSEGYDYQIQRYIRENVNNGDVRFPTFGISSKSESPVYSNIASQDGGEMPKAHFYKYLIDREGALIASFTEEDLPFTGDDNKITKAIEKLLQAQPKGDRKFKDDVFQRFNYF